MRAGNAWKRDQQQKCEWCWQPGKLVEGYHPRCKLQMDKVKAQE